MRTLYRRLIFVLIVPTFMRLKTQDSRLKIPRVLRLISCVLCLVSSVFFLVGCGIDIGPGAYTEDDVYYEGSVYDPYYDAGSPTRAYDYDPSYDPWTVSTYYQYYIDASGADTSSGSSTTGGARSESKRSFATAGDFTSVHQSRAPGNERASVRRDRSATRERRSTDSESSSSSITRQKVRRDGRRGTAQTSQKSRAKRGGEQTQRTHRKKVRSSKAGEEDKEKK